MMATMVSRLATAACGTERSRQLEKMGFAFIAAIFSISLGVKVGGIMQFHKGVSNFILEA